MAVNPADSYFIDTALHLPFDDDLRDRSRHANRVSAAGVSISTTNKKYGPGSAIFDGVSSYLLPFSTDRQFQGDFCVEFWLRSAIDTTGMAVYPRILASASTQAANNLQLRISAEAGFVGKFEVIANGNLAFSASPINDGVWHHVAVDRRAGTLRLFVDGVVQASVANTDTFIMPTSTRIGSRQDSAGYFNGALDDFRITAASRYAANFSPPAAIEYFNWDGQNIDAPVSQAVTYAYAPYTPPATLAIKADLPTPVIANPGGTLFGGRGRITGTAKEKGTPDAPVYRRVRLFNDRDGQCVAETWSDPATGVYVFEYINAALKYTVLSYDHTGQFRAVVADNLTPEIMS